MPYRCVAMQAWDLKFHHIYVAPNKTDQAALLTALTQTSVCM